jgi:outer membrane protein assembly factor BamB
VQPLRIGKIYSIFYNMRLFLCLLLLCSPCVFAQSNDPAQNGYLWRQAVGGVVIGTPSAQPGSVAAALDSGVVKVYSESGGLLWSFSARGRLCPYIKRSREGITFICGTDGSLIAINRIGRELWKANAGGALSGPIVTGWDGRVFVPAAGKISCYTSSGTRLWASELRGKISAGPLLDQNGCIALALDNSELVHITPFGAVRSWKLTSVPAILVPVGKDILALYSNGNILRVDSSEEDSAPLPFSGLTARPLAAAGRNGRAAVFLANGQIVLLSGNDGKIIWTAGSFIRPQTDEKTEIVFDERGIYALSSGGAAGFSPDGKLLWSVNLENTSGIPAYSDDGVLYSGGKDWVLNAWKLEDRTLNQKHTLYGPAPDALYGTGNPPPSIFARVIGRFYEMSVKNELEMIQKGISSGMVGANELEWFAYLMETADGGYWPGASNSREPKALINHRILALQLLSRMGSIETIPWLVSFFRRENEPLVRIAAALAIGGIGMDPDGKAIQEFMNTVRTGNPIHDEQLFIAIAAATGSLCRFSGPPLYDTGFQLLDLLNHPGLPPLVRRQAQNELNSLK